jgi:hypothetical protein
MFAVHLQVIFRCEGLRLDYELFVRRVDDYQHRLVISKGEVRVFGELGG